MNIICLWIVACGCLSKPIFGNSGDGFNVYKDFLRGRTDDLDDMVAAIQEPVNERMIYFYRTPLYPETGAADEDAVSQFKKRTVNKFKSAFEYYSLMYKLAHLQHLLFLDMMLNKDSIATAVEESEAVSKEARAIYIPRMMTKRVPGALLSWAIPTAHRFRNANHINRFPGLTRPSAVS